MHRHCLINQFPELFFYLFNEINPVPSLSFSFVAATLRLPAVSWAVPRCSRSSLPTCFSASGASTSSSPHSSNIVTSRDSKRYHGHIEKYLERLMWFLTKVIIRCWQMSSGSTDVDGCYRMIKQMQSNVDRCYLVLMDFIIRCWKMCTKWCYRSDMKLN